MITNEEAMELLGMPVILSTEGMAYYGILRGVTDEALTVVTSNYVPVSIGRERVKRLSELKNAMKHGLKPDAWRVQ